MSFLSRLFGGQPAESPASAKSSTAPAFREALCDHCSLKRLHGARFCPYCGKPYTAEAVQRPMQPRVDLTTGMGVFGLGIVGESNYQATLRRISGGRLSKGTDVLFTALLIPEPSNPYDGNAIKVCSEDGFTLGYLSRAEALDYKSLFDGISANGSIGCCTAKLIGGYGQKRSIGVVLDIKGMA